MTHGLHMYIQFFGNDQHSHAVLPSWLGYCHAVHRRQGNDVLKLQLLMMTTYARILFRPQNLLLGPSAPGSLPRFHARLKHHESWAKIAEDRWRFFSGEIGSDMESDSRRQSINVENIEADSASHEDSSRRPTVSLHLNHAYLISF